MLASQFLAQLGRVLGCALLPVFRLSDGTGYIKIWRKPFFRQCGARSTYQVSLTKFCFGLKLF